ncbi:MAG TPA: hypothetical protein VKU61_01990 [Candidatus Binatia bacterium]|nr:hypothetical protein [Candidatus Binatia bacterium]
MRARHVLVGIVLLSTTGLASAAIKTVALQGDQTPQPTFFYRKFTAPAVSDTPGAHVADYALAIGKRCIYLLDPSGGSNATEACQRDAAPPNGLFRRLNPPSVALTGDVAWIAKVSFGRGGVFRSGPSPVALVGDAVPAPGTGVLAKITSSRITDSGDVAFQSDISGGAVVAGVEQNQGLFRCTGGNGNCSTGGTGTLQTLLLVGDPVPDRTGRHFCAFLEVTASTFGVAFRATTKLDCSAGAEIALTGVFRIAFAGAAETLGLAGEVSEPVTTPGGSVYASFDRPAAIENGGSVAFVASTSGVPATSAIYRCDSGTCPAAPASAIVLRGDVAAPSESFQLFSQAAISAAKDVAFTARLAGPTAQYGLFVRRAAGGPPDTIVLNGDSVPDSPSPATFLINVTTPGMSSGGKISFMSRIRRTVSPRSRKGIFVVE